MKQLSLITVLIVSFFTAAYSQGVEATNDPAAKKVLDAVSAKFKTYKGVQSDFTLQIEDSKGKIQGERKGTVYMKGSKYRVKIGPAAETEQDIFFDGKNVWTYDRASNEVTITQADESTGGITPQKLFSNFYDKDFLYKLNGEKTVNGKLVQEIEMTPVDKTKAFHKVYVLVDKKAQTIYRTRVLDKSGNVYSYTVNNLQAKPTLSDALFVFNKKDFPGVEELDLR